MTDAMTDLIRRLETLEHDADSKQSSRTLRDAIALLTTQAETEAKLREELWINHGCNVAVLYGDDGEMQCANTAAHRLADFKRQPLSELVMLAVGKQAAMREELAQVKAERDERNRSLTGALEHLELVSTENARLKADNARLAQAAIDPHSGHRMTRAEAERRLTDALGTDMLDFVLDALFPPTDATPKLRDTKVGHSENLAICGSSNVTIAFGPSHDEIASRDCQECGAIFDRCDGPDVPGES
jgi:hypothetical protein